MKRTPALLLMMILLVLAALPLAAQDDEEQEQEVPPVAALTPQAICEAASPAPDPATRSYSAPESVLQPGVDYRAIFCTEAGPVYIDLFENYTPVTVNSFVFLAQNGYYNNTTFHRVLAGFMAQGGDPTGTGGGGPGYQFMDEPVGFLTFDRPGWLAMANAGPATNGSQFFITTAPTPHLDFDHTIFGEVLEGLENVEALRLRDPQTSPDFAGSTLHTVIIITNPATVITSYSAPESTITADDVLAALLVLQGPDMLPGEFLVVDESTGQFGAADLLEDVPDDQQEEFGARLAQYNFDYRASLMIRNATCAPNWAFSWMRYSVDAFASAADATLALDEGFIDTLITSKGFTLADDGGSLPFGYYRRATPSCEGGTGVHGLMPLQRGRYIALVELILPDALQDNMSQLLVSFVALNFESFLASVYRTELR